MNSHFDPGAFQLFEQLGWERKAGAYYALYAPISGYVIDALLDAAGVGPGLRVLDVGSGPGYVTARAAQRGAQVIGVDLAEAMVRLARQLHPGLYFEVGDAQILAFPTGSFDAVVGNFALQHLPHQLQALEGFVRVLVPGGRLAMTVWDEPTRCRFLGLFTDSVRLAGASPPPDLPAGPPMAASDGAYEDLLTTAGFQAPRIQTIAYHHHFTDADELWNGLLSASVRTAALITGQAPEVQARIRAMFDGLIVDYATPEGLEIPISVKLLSASRTGVTSAHS
jgi:SAM-dependent methyltransferase